MRLAFSRGTARLPDEVLRLFAGLAAPLPWRSEAGNPGVLLNRLGRTACVVDVDSDLDDAQAAALADLVALIVNTAGGFAPAERGGPQ